MFRLFVFMIRGDEQKVTNFFKNCYTEILGVESVLTAKDTERKSTFLLRLNK